MPAAELHPRSASASHPCSELARVMAATNETIAVRAQDLRVLVARMFVATGVASDAAARVADGLVEADLEGASSHGVMLVDMYVERIRRGAVSTGTSARVVSDRGAAVVLDASHALGQLTGEQAIALARSPAERVSCERRIESLEIS